jgi:prepilin-type processing-associated H-X9-DG protein
MNAWLSPPDLTAMGGGTGAPTTLAAVAQPAGTIMLCDAGYSNSPVALDLDHYLTLGMQEQVLPSERHHDAANFCFVDGHVKKLPEPTTRSPEYLWDLE